jgi:hypothetical protein
VGLQGPGLMRVPQRRFGCLDGEQAGNLSSSAVNSGISS